MFGEDLIFPMYCGEEDSDSDPGDSSEDDSGPEHDDYGDEDDAN